MAVRNEGPVLALPAAGTITRGERVILNSSRQWAQAGVNDKAEAVAEADATVGVMLPARLLNCGGSVKIKMGVAVAVAGLIYSAASGKGGVTNTNRLEGKALEAATADGDIIEMLPKETSIAAL